MTLDEILHLQSLSESATPGPWFVRQLDDEYCMGAVAVSTKPDTGENESMRAGKWPGHEIVAACMIQQPAYVVPADDRFDENAALIAAVRTSLSELLRLARIGLDVETAAKG